jgi:hypothetical protein
MHATKAVFFTAAYDNSSNALRITTKLLAKSFKPFSLTAQTGAQEIRERFE